MKFRLIFFALAFSFFLANANVGCSTYNGLYPNSLNSTNALTGNAYYSNTNYIQYRYYDQDPNCGIRDTKVSAYIPITYCDVMGVRTYGMLVNYNPADMSCMQLPIDQGLLPLMILSGVVSFFKIRKNLGMQQAIVKYKAIETSL